MLDYLKRPKEYYSKIMSLLWPVALQTLLSNLVSIIDTLFLGSFGEEAVAAATLANIPANAVEYFFFGLQGGTVLVASQLYGKDDKDGMCRAAGVATWSAFIVTTLFALPTVIAPKWFFSFFGNEESVIEQACVYGKYISLSNVLYSLTLVYFSVLQSMSKPLFGSVMMTVCSSLKVLLTLIFINGVPGICSAGLEGAGLATLVSRLVCFAAAVVHLICSKYDISFWNVLKPGKNMLSMFVKTSGVILIDETVWGIVYSSIVNILGRCGNSVSTLAAFSAMHAAEKLLISFAQALSSVSTVVLCTEIGAGNDRRDIKRNGYIFSTMSVVLGVILGGAILLLSGACGEKILYPLFGLESDSREICSTLMKMCGVNCVMRSFCCVTTCGIIRGCGDISGGAFIDLAPFALLSLPFAYITGSVLHMEANVVYLSFFVYYFFQSTLAFFRLRQGKWVVNVVSEKKDVIPHD